MEISFSLSVYKTEINKRRIQNERIFHVFSMVNKKDDGKIINRTDNVA